MTVPSAIDIAKNNLDTLRNHRCREDWERTRVAQNIAQVKDWLRTHGVDPETGKRLA